MGFIWYPTTVVEEENVNQKGSSSTVPHDESEPTAPNPEDDELEPGPDVSLLEEWEQGITDV